LKTRVKVGVPATTANLGPGFDCLGLTLDLWNEADFELTGEGFRVEIAGKGPNRLPSGKDNLVVRSFLRCLERKVITRPSGLIVRMQNNIPTGSGLGSSATAVLMGILAANEIYDLDLCLEEKIEITAGMEGHADNAAAALLGGLVTSVHTETGWLAQRFDVPKIQTLVVLPEVNLPTCTARQALPRRIPHEDAVFNIGRAVMVVEALRSGDLDLLAKVMEDRIHVPYRLKLIPGAEEAITAARKVGAAASLSGAGPGVIAFSNHNEERVALVMQNAFTQTDIKTRVFRLSTINQGAWVR
jgi:homoserine kinase